MILNKRLSFFSFLFILPLVPFFFSPVANAISPKNTIQPEIGEKPSNPLYSRYKFKKQKTIINIGIQPLYLPTGHITETVERDLILQETLDASGVEINFFPFLKGEDINYFVKTGQLDGGIIGDMGALALASVKDIFMTTLVQRGNTSLVAEENIWIDDLKGKKIGYTPCSPGHYGLLKALEEAGINTSEVTLVPMDPHEFPEAMTKGTIAAFTSGEPTVSVSLILNRKLQTLTRAPSTGFFFITKEFHDKHEEVTYQLTASIVRAIRWMKQDKKNLLKAGEWAILEGDKITENSANELSAEHSFNLTIRDILGSLKFPTITENDFRTKSDLHEEFEFLRKKKMIPENTSWTRIIKSFNSTLIKKILTAPEQYRINEFKYAETHNHSHYF